MTGRGMHFDQQRSASKGDLTQGNRPESPQPTPRRLTGAEILFAQSIKQPVSHERHGVGALSDKDAEQTLIELSRPQDHAGRTQRRRELLEIIKTSQRGLEADLDARRELEAFAPDFYKKFQAVDAVVDAQIGSDALHNALNTLRDLDPNLCYRIEAMKGIIELY